MKPQCNTSADCLRELARVMDQFNLRNIVDTLCSRYVKYIDREYPFNSYGVPLFNHPADWQFALAEVEGRPVFVGDELYDETGLKLIAEETYSVIFLQTLSWNPPKPATVMVELTVSQAELGAKLGLTTDIAQACKTALEKLKS